MAREQGELIFFDLEPSVEVLEDRLMVMSQLILDMVGPLEAARDIIAAGVRRRFRTQTDPDGIPWKYWSPNYEPRALREIASGIHRGKILERTLALRDAASSPYAYQVTYDSVFIQFEGLPEYAAVQNFGGSVGRGALIPARPFMGIDDIDQARIDAVFADFLDYVAGGTSRSRGALGRFVSVRGL